MAQFTFTDEFSGYVTRQDETNTSPQHLVDGSQNVVINASEKVESRRGYELYGAESSSGNPIESAYVWNTSTVDEYPLRSHDDELEFYYDGAWRRLADSWSNVDFQYSTVWDETESIDLLLFVNGATDLYEWSGGVTTFDSATSNTLTKEGSTTWAEERFYTAGTRTVIIDGTEYTYTGGESTDTLTGVSPDPTSAGHSAGEVVHQKIRTNSDAVGSAFNLDLISVGNNQVYLADKNKHLVYASADDDHTDYTLTSPRAPGDPLELTLDSRIVGFMPQEEDMYVTAGKDEWYRTKFTLSSDLTNEEVEIKKLDTGSQAAAQSQDLIGKMKNSIFFVSNEPTLDELGRVENVDTPQSRPISDPIKPDFDSYDFTGGDTIYFKNQLFISVPEENIVLIYDIERGFWQPPQTLPVRFFSIIDGELYGHSKTTAETYKLFTGRNDNDNPILSIVRFAYQRFGLATETKNFTEIYSEGYVTEGTKITAQVYYDYRGSSGIREFIIDAADKDIIFTPSDDASIGKTVLGKEPLGSTTTEGDIRNKFRVIHETQELDFYEAQVAYEVELLDESFEVMRFGLRAYKGGANNQIIKE